MQGLRVLYEYQGRTAEWARLVAEIVPDYCTPDDGPIPGREDDYSLVMGYRVDLAQDYDRDLPAAAALQAKLVAWDRQQATPALALPAAAPLDADQRNRIRTLGVSLETLGHILREQGSPDCVAAYEEAIRYCQRIGDTASEAITHYNLGHAYKDLPAIRDLDAAEAAYRRSLALHDPNDALGRSRCIKQIGMVHHARFDEARQRGEPAAVVLQHAQAAEQHYHQALALCPPSAIADLGPMHNQLGNLYAEVGQIEPAREHYERAAQICEQTGNRYGAGQSPLQPRPHVPATPPGASRRRPAAATCCAAPRPTRRPACATSSTTRAAPPMDGSQGPAADRGHCAGVGVGGDGPSTNSCTNARITRAQQRSLRWHCLHLVLA